MSASFTSEAESEPERPLKALLRISEKLNAASDLDNLLDELIEQTLELTDAESGCAGLRGATGMFCDRYLRAPDILPPASGERPQTSWPAWVLAHKTPYLTSYASDGATSGMCIPILDSKKDVLAYFEVFNKRKGKEFTPRDLKNSLAAAQIASLAIQKAITHNRLLAIAAFSRSLTLAGDLEQVLETVGHHAKLNFDRDPVILLTADNGLSLRFQTPGFLFTTSELEAASSCSMNGQECGCGTTSLPDARYRYLPLKVRGQTIGVLGLDWRPEDWISTLQREILPAFISQAAVAIERGLLENKLSRLRSLDESDRVQNALLTAVSHEVRAPLAAITAAVSGLLDPRVPLQEADKHQLLRTAQSEAKRLHRLMNNLLNVTRLQAGVWRVKIEPCDFSDVAGAALEELGEQANERDLTIELAPDIPLVPMDFDLITQVLVNLIGNAIKFTSSDQKIHLRARIVGSKLETMVLDEGMGIPEDDLTRVFQKFHRTTASSAVKGLGLGLSICKEFVEAHHGEISLERNPGGGTIARFVLPISLNT